MDKEDYLRTVRKELEALVKNRISNRDTMVYETIDTDIWLNSGKEKVRIDRRYMQEAYKIIYPENIVNLIKNKEITDFLVISILHKLYLLVVEYRGSYNMERFGEILSLVEGISNYVFEKEIK